MSPSEVNAAGRFNAFSLPLVAARYMAHLGVMLGVFWLGITLWPVRSVSSPPIAPWRGQSVLDGAFRWDGGWYWSIAENGYAYSPGQQSNVAFFPAYPFLTRVVRWFVGDTVNSMMILTVLGACAACCGIATWCRIRGVSQRATWIALSMMLLFPYAWFVFGVAYSDGLFLGATVWACVMLERRRYVAAGLLGALASATRPTGLAVIACLVVGGLEVGGVLQVAEARGMRLLRRFDVPNRLNLSVLKPRLLAPAISALGLGGYMAYLAVRFGDPLLFSRVQQYWGQPSGALTLLKDQYFRDLFAFSRPAFVLTTTLQAAFLLIGLASVPFVGRRFGWRYGIFTLVLVALPLYGSKDFMGSGRYVLALFPTFVLVAERLSIAPLWQRVSYFGASSLAALVLSLGFAHGIYLA